MKKHNLLTLFVGLLFLTLGAATSPQAQTESKVTEEFHQTYQIAPDGRVSLENINGSVRITSWDRSEIKVDAIKSAYTRERLDEAKIVVTPTSNSLSIKTEYPERNMTFTDDTWSRRNNPASVEYTLTVPRGVRLDAIQLINGDLEISGVSGDVKASAINGRVVARGLTGEAKLATINSRLEATFDQINQAKPITLSSVNGGVALVIPSDSNAELKASTVHGAISNDFGLPVRRGKYVGRDLAGKLGQGGVRIRLNNVNGSINITHAADGRAISPATNLLPETSGDDDASADAEQMRAEAQRAARDAQRDVQLAQREIQREAERAAREALREHDVNLTDAQRERIRAERERTRELRRAEVERQRDARDAARVLNRTVIVDSRLTVVNRQTKTFAVSGTPRVTLQTFDGHITVHAWDKPEVTVNSIERAGDEQQSRGIRLQTEQRGSEISIIADFDKAFARQIAPGTDSINASVSLEVYVPRQSILHVTSGDGRLLIEGVSGQVEARTGDGAIDVSGGRGQLNAHTGDGRIRISNFDGQVEARTGDGSISLDGRFQQLSAHTGDGSISLAVPADTNASLETDAETVVNDGLAVEETQGGAAAATRTRRWRIGGGGALYRLQTGDGRIVLRQADGSR